MISLLVLQVDQVGQDHQIPPKLRWHHHYIINSHVILQVHQMLLVYLQVRLFLCYPSTVSMTTLSWQHANILIVHRVLFVQDVREHPECVRMTLAIIMWSQLLTLCPWAPSAPSAPGSPSCPWIQCSHGNSSNHHSNTYLLTRRTIKSRRSWKSNISLCGLISISI